MSDYIIPSSIADRQKVKEAVVQISNSMERKKSEADFITETKKRIEKEIGIPRKQLQQMAKDYNKQEFDKRVHENEEYKDLYETIMK